jgi:hypothetical protein
LKPLGHRIQNRVKYFAKQAVAAKCANKQWLHKVALLVPRYRQKKNAATAKKRGGSKGRGQRVNGVARTMGALRPGHNGIIQYDLGA